MVDEFILGICAFTHDSSATLLRGRELVGFLEEDRLSGLKHTNAFPELAIAALLRSAGIGRGEVGAVAYPFDSTLYELGRAAANRRPGPLERRARGVASYDRISDQHRRSLARLRDSFPSAAVVEVPHHNAHAYSAVAPAGWRSADVLVIDSIGEAVTTSIGRWDRVTKSLNLIPRGFDTDSVGYLYGAVTDHLGFRMRDEEGTVMALAAGGDPRRFRTLFSRILKIDTCGIRLDPQYVHQRVFGDSGNRLTSLFTHQTVGRRAAADPIQAVHADLAAALQERTGQVFESLCANSTASLRAISGGVATNCVAVGLLRQRWPDVEFFVPPAPGDSGTSLGAAVGCLLERHGELASIPAHPYWGPTPEPPQIATLLSAGLRFENMPTAALASECARRIAGGEIIGVYRGPAEAGPRALGHRSILADPRVEGVRHRLALRVKKRELFRPFAPITRLSQADEFVELGRYGTPYMSAALRARDKLCELAPVVVHTNGTTRMQTVEVGQDQFIEQVIDEFERLTGSPILINTSLNSKGSPTVGTRIDAIACLTDMELDALVLDNDLVTKV
ncbi:carbamoyltransferase C-terminal domain-containing protein [Nocardia salmonicida]|uniref:carbamoyltransferase C-terminal domain-containing protein n=1 Tax=Nocardia salmonicida TaxID=53431 RepID=UPI002E2C2472|nr:carbamoyltransferase C-terminal domain-containing protein [Nocardia salmonicida]